MTTFNVSPLLPGKSLNTARIKQRLTAVKESASPVLRTLPSNTLGISGALRYIVKRIPRKYSVREDISMPSNPYFGLEYVVPAYVPEVEGSNKVYVPECSSNPPPVLP